MGPILPTTSKITENLIDLKKEIIFLVTTKGFCDYKRNRMTAYKCIKSDSPTCLEHSKKYAILDEI